MPLFQPKHQKLILQCYPPGRGFDKKPNSSELSYLLYYASTRRVKLEKVGRFLEKKNATDISRGRTGNVQVTLELIDALMQKCPDDVNVFAENAVAILTSVAASGDLGLCQHAEPVYHTFCITLNDVLITGDQHFVESFVGLTQRLFNLGLAPHNANPTEWKAIALKAAASFALSRFISLGKGREALKSAIPLVVNEIQKDFTEDTLLKRIASHGSEQHSLSRFNTAKTTPKSDEPGTPKEINTDDMAIAALKSFFHTTSTTQLMICTKLVSAYLGKNDVDHDWASAITEMVANWIPVQLRFIVLSVLIGELHKDGNPKEQLVYLHILSRLLSSNVSFVGLGLDDHLRKLVEHQVYLIDTESTNKELIRAYAESIGSLASHVYYHDHVVDMVAALLVKLKECSQAPTKKFKSIVMVLLDDIKNVLVTSHTHATVQRTMVSLELFADTFPLLSYNESTLSFDENFLIRNKYIDLLISVIELEYNKDDAISPDHKHMISGARVSVINQFYEQLEKCAELPEDSNFDSLLTLIDLISQKFGINAIVNVVPFLLQWQLPEGVTGRSAVLRDNFGYCILYFTSKALHFGDLVEQTLARIDYRKSNNTWIVSSTIPLEKSGSSPQSTFTKEQLNDYFNHTSLDKYHETIFTTHYKYNNSNSTTDNETDFDAHNSSFMSNTDSQNVSLANLLQPTVILSNDNNSIKSAPLSARSLLIGRLHAPKVQELRKAISGSSLKMNGFANGSHSNGNGTAVSKQRTDARTLLEDLSLGDDLEDQGALTLRA